MREKILVVCAHPDDEVLGCGGSLLKHRDNKNEINLIFVFEGSSARYDSFNKMKSTKDIQNREGAAKKISKILKARSISFLNYPNLRSKSSQLLDITKKIEKKIKEINPNIIYTHSNSDLNRDHRLCLEMVMTATRPVLKKKIRTILSFEIPSSTEWSYSSFGSFVPNYFENIDYYVKEKIKLMKIYKSEIKKKPHPRSAENILSQSRIAGSQCGFSHAERFQIIRIINQ